MTYPGLPPSAPIIDSTVYEDGQWNYREPVPLTWAEPIDNPAPVFAYYYAIDANVSSGAVLTPSALIISSTICEMVISGISEGSHEFHLVAQGEPTKYPLSPESVFHINKDQTPPVLVTLSSPTHPTSAKSPNDCPVFDVYATEALSGIVGYRIELDHIPATIPDGSSPLRLASPISFSGLADGDWWFHVRVQDGAGNISSVAHYEVNISFRTMVSVTISSQTHPEGVESPGNAPRFLLTLHNPDSATIVSFHYRLDQSPSTVVTAGDTATTGTAIQLDPISNGSWYFHAAAKSVTGVVTDTAHYGFSVKYAEHALEKNRVHIVPHPVRTSRAVIRYELLSPVSEVTGEILDGTGRKLATLKGSGDPGMNEIVWDASHAANGVYYLRLKVRRQDGKQDLVLKKIALLR